MPKISVIVPFYNAQDYLNRCINSILSQSFKDFELLLIDDGSKDCSLEICKEYLRIDKRIRLFHQKNGGVSSARNLGIINALGEWITFVDSDDLLDVDFLKELSKDTKYDIKAVSLKDFYGNPILGKIYNFEYQTLINTQNIIKIEDFCLRSVIGKLYRKKIIAEFGLCFKNKLNWGEDTLFNLNFILHCNSFRFYPFALYFYDQNQDGLTKKRLFEDEISFLNELVHTAELYDSTKGSLFYLIIRKYGYYHFLNILKNYVFNNSNTEDIYSRLRQIRGIIPVQFIISKGCNIKGKRTRVFEFLLRQNMIKLSVLYAKCLNIINKSLY